MDRVARRHVLRPVRGREGDDGRLREVARVQHDSDGPGAGCGPGFQIGPEQSRRLGERRLDVLFCRNRTHRGLTFAAWSDSKAFLKRSSILCATACAMCLPTCASKAALASLP